MATIKSYTDIEQSKKLAKILPIESADGGWYGTNNPFAANTTFWLHTKYSNKAVFPAWSLAALLSLMPRIGHLKPLINLSPLNPILNSEEVSIYYHSENFISPYIIKDNLIDACYQMILELHKLNLL